MKQKSKIGILWIASLIVVLSATIALANSSQNVLLADDFNRSDSSNLGSPWFEENESMDFTHLAVKPPHLPTDIIGPGYIEITNNALAFHQITSNDSVRITRPYVYAPLVKPATNFPVIMSFIYTPHEIERVSHSIGLMSSEAGFLQQDSEYLGQPIGNPTYKPVFGIGVFLTRTDFSASEGSGISIVQYNENAQGPDGFHLLLASKGLPFNYEAGGIYEIKLTINEDLSMTAEVSNGTITETVSSEPIIFTHPLDQFYISDIESGFRGDWYGSGHFVHKFDNILITDSATTKVIIDIKPGSYPNCFNNDGNGVIPVAIFSSPDFDATQVNPLTVELNGQSVRVVGKGNMQAHIEDVNNDSLNDLIVQIEDMDNTYQEGDTIATLTGQTFDGTLIEGSDSICIVP